MPSWPPGDDAFDHEVRSEHSCRSCPFFRRLFLSSGSFSAVMCSHLSSSKVSFQSPKVCFNISLRCCMFDLQHRLVVSLQTREVDRFGSTFYHSCPSDFFRRLVFTSERDIIEFFKAETDTNTLTCVFQQSRLQIFHDERMMNRNLDGCSWTSLLEPKLMLNQSSL